MPQTHTAAPILTEAEYEALANFRYALRRFAAFSDNAAHAAGLPPQQHQALLAIRGAPDRQPMTIGALAERLLVAPHTATELVGRLVDAGYVTRSADIADKRRHRLALTEKADAVLSQLTRVHLEEVRDLAPQLIGVLAKLAAI